MAHRDFQSLYGSDGLGRLVQEDATNTTVAASLKRAINDAWVKYGGGRFWWNKRTHDYTASSTPALPTAGNRLVTLPTATGSEFDQPYRLYYRQAGQVVDVELLEDDLWLQYSATRATDVSYPAFARLVHSGSAAQFELDRPVSQQFIDNITTLSLEYFVVPADMSADTDQPTCPGRLRPHLITLAGFDWAMQQGDQTLIASMTRQLGKSVTTAYEEARLAFRRHDLKRTGRAGTFRPRDHYSAQGSEGVTADYGRRNY